MRQFKIRCSAIGSIMGGMGLTDLQITKLAELTEKFNANKITANQSAELEKLKAKKANPDIPEGAKTYCQEWAKEQIYGRTKIFSSKYTDKGLSVEDEAIALASEVYGWGLVSKNEQYYKDPFKHGTPDLVLKDLIPDIKNAWDCFTFPLYESKIDIGYWWQLQGYMSLTGKNNAAIIYCLMDAPESLVEAEARKLSYKAGLNEVDADFYEEVRQLMTYSHLPNELRIKRFDVARDDKAIEQIDQRVIACRGYLETIGYKAKELVTI